MKKKTAFLIMLGLLIFLLASCEKKEIYNLSQDELSFKDQLISHGWTSGAVLLEGTDESAADIFGAQLSLSFSEDGFFQLEMKDETLEGKWKIRDGYLRLDGKGLRAQAQLVFGYKSDQMKDFYLDSIEDVPIEFLRDDYYYVSPEEEEKREKRRSQEEQTFIDWKEELAIDLSSCQPELVRMLFSRGFKPTEELAFDGSEEEAFLEKYFRPLLSLGLEKASWTYDYEGPMEAFLDSYEIYVFNAGLNPSERKNRAGETEWISYDEVEEYIRSHLRVEEGMKDGIYVDELEEGLIKSSRFSGWSLQMKILDEEPKEFPLELEGARLDESYGENILIHLLYPGGGHGWFLIEVLKDDESPFYLGGSFIE